MTVKCLVAQTLTKFCFFKSRKGLVEILVDIKDLWKIKSRHDSRAPGYWVTLSVWSSRTTTLQYLIRRNPHKHLTWTRKYDQWNILKIRRPEHFQKPHPILSLLFFNQTFRRYKSLLTADPEWKGVMFRSKCKISRDTSSVASYANHYSLLTHFVCKSCNQSFSNKLLADVLHTTN